MEEEKDDGVMRIYFDPPHYTVMENIATLIMLTSKRYSWMPSTR